MGNIRRRSLMRSSALAGALSLAVASAAVAAEQNIVAFDMPEQSLGESLRDFYRASGEQIVFSESIVAGRRAPLLKGDYTPDQALAMLLDGTNLTARRTATGVVMIEAPQSQSAAGDGAEGTVEALIVTAQKREEDIQDVPIAISAFTQETLERSQVAGGPDLMTQVPNMTFTKTNFTSYSIQLRGIGTQAISATTDAAVAVAFNNTPFIRNRFFEQEFYDLQRVEVLRGPQGTLYGRNATAGVVNLISQKPKFTYEAKASGDVGNYNSTRVEGMINVPLVEDVVALRLAGAWTKREGYTQNQITGTPIDGRDLWSTRLSLRFTPSDRLDANLIWEHFEEDDDRLRSGKQLCNTDVVESVAGMPVEFFEGAADFGGLDQQFTTVQGTFSQACKAASLYSPDSFQTPNGIALPYYIALSAQGLPAALADPYVSRFQSQDLRVIESTVDPVYKAKTDVVEFQLGYDLTDSLTLTSETGYSVDEIFSMQDYNRFNTQSGAWETTNFGGGANYWVQHGIITPDGFFCDPQIGCADRLVGIDVSTARSRHFSEELRLASNYDGPFNFSLGANFLRYDTEDKYYVFFNSLTIYSASTGIDSPTDQWVPGVTDNFHCLPAGFKPPRFDESLDILDCIYIDPNPILALNDLGHNYFLSKNPYKLISYAVFGEAYYNITDTLKVTAGLRWTVDKKEAPRIPSWVLGGGAVGYPVAEVVEQEWQEPTGRVAVDWKPDLAFTDDTMVYASYAHGYKAGGMNPPATGMVMRGFFTGEPLLRFLEGSAANPKTFEPEFIDAFEIGTKNTMLDGRLTANLAAFYYDYEGYQISQIVDRSAVNLNFDAEVWGLELESDWRPIENLKFGLKLGYENTRVADGMRAIDLMDRTAGDPNWVIVRPFPTFPSNCVMPAWLMVGNDWRKDTNPNVVGIGGRSGGNMGGCELAYVLGEDPVLGGAPQLYPFREPGFQPAEYARDNTNYAGWSTDINDYPCWPNDPNTGQPLPIGNEYPGVDLECMAALSNNGVGFYKDLSGNELPNAPNFTATLTADYSIPLPNEWLATLHTDLYYQSEAWTRIFNTEGYDKLKAYTNVNLAAIFTNEALGWKVMAYVKNVFDRDSITGAFLNSDDTGLTTNVFLTEPRLYGLRVTKEWTGGPWWTGSSLGGKGPFPLTVELWGQVQRHDAPYEAMWVDWANDVPDGLNPTGVQNRDLDWGDGRSVKLTWRPDGSPWSVSGAVRYGRTNSGAHQMRGEIETTHHLCGVPPGHPFYFLLCNPASPYYEQFYGASHPQTLEWSDGIAKGREEHSIIDFSVGRDVGLGGLSHSTFNAGLRHAQFESRNSLFARAVVDWQLAAGWLFFGGSYVEGAADLRTQREFEGAGPMLSWDAAMPLLGNDQSGHLNVDWSIGAGALFGKQETVVEGDERMVPHSGSMKYPPIPGGTPVVTPRDTARTQDVTAPVVDLSLGLSYEAGRIKLGAGYRWERYFDVLDVGFQEERSDDRTIDGPYFKLSVGFGG